MSNHARDYDKIVALLKSAAAPCDNVQRTGEHEWRKCRHCLALQELDYKDIRRMLGAFLLAVETADRDYGVKR